MSEVLPKASCCFVSVCISFCRSARAFVLSSRAFWCSFCALVSALSALALVSRSALYFWSVVTSSEMRLFFSFSSFFSSLTCSSAFLALAASFELVASNLAFVLSSLFIAILGFLADASTALFDSSFILFSRVPRVDRTVLFSSSAEKLDSKRVLSDRADSAASSDFCSSAAVFAKDDTSRLCSADRWDTSAWWLLTSWSTVRWNSALASCKTILLVSSLLLLLLLLTEGEEVSSKCCCCSSCMFFWSRESLPSYFRTRLAFCISMRSIHVSSIAIACSSISAHTSSRTRVSVSASLPVASTSCFLSW
mmetsp:Transcript_49887/g.97842  ORF Transcript_49887/g.97842 Transcript_49887/m.97842 type:complete len:308 (+) Transcript_49887:1649-2572(+)